jgi:hypothetical protein
MSDNMGKVEGWRFRSISVAAHTRNSSLTFIGSQFVLGSVATWNGSARTTVFMNAGQLRVAIPAADPSTAQTASLRANTSLSFSVNQTQGRWR